ncbi:MAG TPA: SDR family oxidoreductase [Propionibacterium sp.]|jgi:3-oxoacyl-[acyl-carrier protein] reductase|nr:SDR family oxidoreductase [Propionibacterium sp.]
MARQPSPPLIGRVALVTGVSRRQGIAFAVTKRLLAMGADVFVTHHRPHDEVQPWGADDVDAVLADLRGIDPNRRVEHLGADLAHPAAPRRVVDAASAAYGHLDILVCVHAQSGGDGPLADMTAATLDQHYAVNTRSTILLTRELAARHDGRPGGRVVWFTSGQQLGPMRDEIAYAASKAALAGVAASVADDLIDRGILLNVINPGPVDTGYLSPAGGFFTPEQLDGLRTMFPLRRFGEPDDVARLVAFLVSDEGRWVVGQVLNSEGGFRRWVVPD